MLFVQNHDIISSIESTNEPDADEFNGKTTIPDWEEQVCRFQKEIWDSVHAQPLLANIPVLGPSLIRGFSYDRDVGDMSATLDFINVHPYYDGFSPENYGWGGNGYGSVEYTRTTFSPPAPGKPLIATETGGAVCARNPDSIQILYLPRMYAFQFNHGIDRTFWFQLSDEARGFGLLDSSDNPRPVYYTLLNFLTILRDTTATATAPSALNYTFGGDTTDVEGTLLSRPDGQFDLLLWISHSAWDPNAKTSTVIPEQSVTLSFAGAIDSLRVVQPDRGTSFTPVSVNGSTASISVSNHCVFSGFGRKGFSRQWAASCNAHFTRHRSRVLTCAETAS